MRHRAKKRLCEKTIIELVTAGASLINTEAGEDGVNDSEIPAPGESIHGKSECNTGGEVTSLSL